MTVLFFIRLLDAGNQLERGVEVHSGVKTVLEPF